MRQRTIRIICLAMAFVLLAGCTVMQTGLPGHRGQKNTQAGISVKPATLANTDGTSPATSATEAATTVTEQPKPIFLHAGHEKEPGVPKSILRHHANYAYGVHYPSVGDEAVDGQIEAFAKSIAGEFDESVQGYLVGPERERAIMQADYKAYISTDATADPSIPCAADALKSPCAADISGSYRLLSVVFEVFPGVHGSQATGRKIKTLLFDLNTGKRLMQTDVFGCDYTAVVAGIIVAKLTGQAEYAEHTKTELFVANTSPKAENFLNFAFIQGQAVFYFDAARVLPEKFGCVSVSIPVTDLYKVLKTKTSDRAPFRMFNTEEKMIALTFDDGPKTETTARILDVLDEVGGRATFFVLGMMIEKNADVMKRAYLGGSDIENHSYNHKKMALTMSEKDILFQLTECDNRIISVTGARPSFLRMPYGFNNPNTDRLAKRPIIAWSFDTVDWRFSDTKKKNRTTAERDADKQKMIDRVLADVQDGDIVLMHDIHLFSVEVCEALIPKLAAEGFQLVTVNELFAARGVQLENGKHYNNARK